MVNLISETIKQKFTTHSIFTNAFIISVTLKFFAYIFPVLLLSLNESFMIKFRFVAWLKKMLNVGEIEI